MALEFAAERCEKTAPESRNEESTADQTIIRGEDGRLILPTDEIVKRITLGKLRGEETDHLAWLFHKMLANQIISACAEIRKVNGIRTAALSGGCFQLKRKVSMF